MALLLGTALAAPAPAGGKDEAHLVNLHKLNTEADETDPFLAPDGLSLYFACNKAGNFDLMESRRITTIGIFPPGKPVEGLAEKGAEERCPVLHKGTLYFAKSEVVDEKLAELRNFDLHRRPESLAPVPLLALSEKSHEMNPWVTPAGKEFYFSRKNDEGWVLYVARGPVPGPIGEAKPVGFAPGFHNATLTPNGLTMFLEGPVDGGRTGIYRSTRAKVGAEWRAPEPVEALASKEGKVGSVAPRLSTDGNRLFFASDRPGGQGGLDLWTVLVRELKEK